MATLQELIESEIADFFAGFGSPGEPETPEDMQSQLLARIAPLLARTEQGPVGYYRLAEDGVSYYLSSPDQQRDGTIPLYAAPQLPQPVVVSEAQSKKLFDEWSGGDAALGELRSNGVPDEFISMLKDFSLAAWEACRESMVKQPAQFIVTSDERMMEMPAAHDIDAVAAMLQGAEPVRQTNTLRDGWVAVPVEPTEEMNKAGWAAMNEHDAINPTYRAMLTAAPDFREISNSSTKHFRENAETSTSEWIPCNERMPERDYVLAADFSGAYYLPSLPNTQVGIYADWFEDGNPSWDEGDGNDLYLKQVTHWMPLPAAPQQEVDGEMD
ncbi:DUF551 domain-containing protein [Leclercia tamurae]|uniref:DUF551 domain-containing protein n=1 Tax=Leclercia tamurae TaxID=2926467 RepID=UPI002F92D19A